MKRRDDSFVIIRFTNRFSFAWFFSLHSGTIKRKKQASSPAPSLLEKKKFKMMPWRYYGDYYRLRHYFHHSFLQWKFPKNIHFTFHFNIVKNIIKKLFGLFLVVHLLFGFKMFHCTVISFSKKKLQSSSLGKNIFQTRSDSSEYKKID